MQDFKIVPQLCSLQQLHEVFDSVNNCDEYGIDHTAAYIQMEGRVVAIRVAWQGR